jgi:hypothetical protein
MQNADGDAVSARSEHRNDSLGSIVSELVSLIEHVRASMKLIEQAIAMETPPGNQEVAANVVLLDDVTPRYQNARAALNTCNRSLEVTLHLLRNADTSDRETEPFAKHDFGTVRLVGRA